jgi:hypothetical protein
MKHPFRIAYDLDGTLSEYPHRFDISESSDDEIADMYVNAEPLEYNIEVVNKSRAKGAFVYIYTARDERWRPITERWLRLNNVHYDALVMNKLWVDLYVGDESINEKDFASLDDLIDNVEILERNEIVDKKLGDLK